MSSGDTYLLFDQFSPDLFTGCPFRHTDADLLRQRLAAYRIPKKGIDEVQLKAITEKGVSFLILSQCIWAEFFIMNYYTVTHLIVLYNIGLLFVYR